MNSVIQVRCLYLFIGAGLFFASGCHSAQKHKEPPHPVEVIPPQSDVPRELSMTTMPTYTIAPPDILAINAIRIVPKSPYRLNPFDVINITARVELPDWPMNAQFTVEPGGTINLGPRFGTVLVAGLTPDKALAAIEDRLYNAYKRPDNPNEHLFSLSLVQIAASQQIAGEHLVAQDGTVMLGAYGSVYVTGMTREQARAAIENHLSQYLDNPIVAVDVFAYNSRVYYVITQGAGFGDRVLRFPVTGNETVLDAIAQVEGLSSNSSRKIWIARPTPGCSNAEILPVDWCGVSGMGLAATNYQILPGDRVFIAEDRLVAFDTALGKLLSPVERVLGVTLLGSSTVNSINGRNGFNGIP